MITRAATRATWLLLAAFLAAATPKTLWAVSYSFTTKADQDTLNVVFDAPGVFPTIVRTGPRQIALQFPPGAVSPPKMEEAINFKQSRFIESVVVAGNRILITCNTNQFGFVGWPAGEEELKLQIYRDPMGANWTPPTEKKTGEPQPQTPKPEAAGPAPNADIPTVTELDLPPPADGSGDGPAASGAVAAPPSSGSGPAALPDLPKLTEPAREPFYAANYAVRSKISKAGPDAAVVLRPNGAPETATGAPSGVTATAPGTSEAGGAVGGRVSAEPVVKLPPIPKEIDGEGEVKSGVAKQGAVRQGVAKQGAAPVAESAAPQPLPADIAVSPESARASGKISRPGSAGKTAQAVTPPPAQEAGGTAGPAAGGVASQTAAVPDASAQGAVQGAVQAPASTGGPAEGAAPQEAAPAPQGEQVVAEAEGAAPEGEAKDPLADETAQYNALVAAQAEKINGEYDKALQQMETLKARPDLARDIREELLYSIAELYFDKYKSDLPANYDKIEMALQEAINFNTKSLRAPNALLQLGLINLKAGNIPEASAYFTILKKKFPNDENVPLINYYWGEHYYDKKEYQKAANEFQTLVEQYPESKFVREGSMGLAKSFVKLGHYDAAAQIADYIDKRWPRYYVEYPPILRITGDIYYKLGKYEKAKELYLAFYNIVPESPETDLILARLGDVYSKLNERVPALQFYDKAAREFPDKEGGLLAKMRLVEHGVYDDPTIQQMFRAFAQPGPSGPDRIYADIVKEHPDSPLAPIAQLKLTIWKLYKGDYLDCIEAGSQFKKLFPDNPLLAKVEETAAQAFDKVAITLMNERNYQRVMSLWRDNPVLAGAEGKIGEQARLSLALAMLRTGSPRESLAMALPLITPKQTQPGTMALMLAMSIYQQGNAWNDLLRLIGRARDWSFTTDQRQRVEFAAALALENLGDYKRSRPLWAKLAADPSLDPGKLAYAMYYQTKQAAADKDAEKVQMYASQAVELFQESGKDPGKLLDSMNMLIEAQVQLGLFPDALKWSEEYAKRVEQGGPDWAANQFRMAKIQRDLGDEAAWKATLEKMRDDMPDSLYGKMAASALSSKVLEQRAEALTNVN